MSGIRNIEPVGSRDNQDRWLAAELAVVERARAESRKEVADLERMKQLARAAFLNDASVTEQDFERSWPELRNHIFRLRAHL